jgi:hypothetical protein
MEWKQKNIGKRKKRQNILKRKKKSNLVTDWIVGGWGHKTK